MRARLLTLAFVAAAAVLAALLIANTADASEVSVFNNETIAAGASSNHDLDVSGVQRFTVVGTCNTCSSTSSPNHMTVVVRPKANGATRVTPIAALRTSETLQSPNGIVFYGAYEVDGLDTVNVQITNGSVSGVSYIYNMWGETEDANHKEGKVVNNITATIPGSVAVSNFPATQPVSGTVTANQGTADATAEWGVNCKTGCSASGGGGDASNATLTSGFNNLHGDLWVVVGVVAGAALLPSFLVLFFGTRGGD